jgi:glycosyltransferase
MQKITLITACYNNAQTILASLISVQQQTYANIEHIIIDGASTDGTLEIIQSHISCLPDRQAHLTSHISVKFISEPDKGMYDAINKGLKLATGDIIGLLHSDDELFEPTTIEKIVKAFEQVKPGLLFANGLFVHAENTHNVVRNWLSKAFKPYKIYFGWVPLHTTMYFSREAFEKLGLYDTNYRIASDYEYSLRALKHSNIPKFYLNTYVVRMKMGGASTSFNNQYRKSKEDFMIMRNYHLPAALTLAFKILRKIPQFFLK